MLCGGMGVSGGTLWNNIQNKRTKPLIMSLRWLVPGDSIWGMSVVVAAFLPRSDWLVNTHWPLAPFLSPPCLKSALQYC